MEEYRLETDYIKWLNRIVFSPGDEHYGQLLYLLMTTEFTWFKTSRNDLYMDENRASDGLALRQQYADEHNISMDEINDILQVGPACSMLEMIVAFAHRIDDEIMYDIQYGDRSAEWFHSMLHSLGIDQYNDSNWHRVAVKRKINIFLRRQYGWNGKGGLFWVDADEVEIQGYFTWIPDFKLDMNQLELWQQMGIWTQLYDAGIVH